MTSIYSRDDRTARDREASDDVLEGLRARPKRVPARLLYDARGARLFERICELDDYYVTRSELALLEHELPVIARISGQQARVIEPGSGAGLKTRMLLAALDGAAEYVPIDISREQLERVAASLHREFPTLVIRPVWGDFTGEIELPTSSPGPRRTLVFFPGSTIGNFEPDDAVGLLARLRALAEPESMLLLGADANTNRDELLRAYDDREGVTAAFDLNVLAHLNRTHAADFELGAFCHRAVWDPERSRIEMQLVSVRRQIVRVAGERFSFERGESVVTEHCYKYSPRVLERLLSAAGWRVRDHWPDPAGRMSLWLATSSEPWRRPASRSPCP